MFEKIKKKSRKKRRIKKINKSHFEDTMALLRLQMHKRENVILSNKRKAKKKYKNPIELLKNSQYIDELPQNEINSLLKKKELINPQFKSTFTTKKKFKRKNLSKLAKQIKTQVKEDKIPEPIKWDQVDVSILFKGLDPSTPLSNEQQKKRNITGDIQLNKISKKIIKTQELKLDINDKLSKDDYDDQDFDFSRLPESLVEKKVKVEK